MAAMRSRVDVNMNFGAITDKVIAQAKQAVTAGAMVGAQVAGRVASQRSRSGKMARMEVLPVRQTPDGYEASFRSPAYYRLFQDLGTLKGRTRKLKKATLDRRNSPSGQARLAKAGDSIGIEPLYFYRAGRRAGTRAMMDVIRRGTD